MPAYTKPWLDWTNKRSFDIVGFSLKRFLVSVFPASKKFDSDLELDAGMHKTDAHSCPPTNNNIAPMPTQNPWAWAWTPNVGLCFLPSTTRNMISRGGLHYGPWSRTMEDGLCQWSEFMVRIPWSDFIKYTFFESLGPLTWCKSNVDQEEWPCTKKWMCWFLIHAQKGQFIKKNQVWPFSCLLLSSLGLHLSSLLVKCVEDVACESSHNTFTKQMSNLICTCSM